jgi:protoporphyrinogen/coproporphyrinogen III oxidase
VFRIAIVGGGISGLSAAFAVETARRNGAAVDYVLYEAGPRFGGVLRTEHVDGCIVEGGPDSFLTEKPWAADLCRQLGLGDQLLPSNDAERKTYILVKGRLLAIPDGLMFMVPTRIRPVLESPLFSLGTKLRMAREWFYPPQKSSRDESVAAFVARHYGAELVDRLAGPLLSGVYGGDAAQLSVRAVLPRFVEMESKYGSLGHGMLAARKKMLQTGSRSAPLFTSLKNGMQSLPDALLQQIPKSALRPATCIELLEGKKDKWQVSAADGTESFDGLVIAAPAHAAATLLKIGSPELSQELAGIAYTSSVIVVLAYDQRVRASLPDGFGFLVPRSEGKRMMATTFVHKKFSHRAPDDHALIRCFFGGTQAEEALNLTEDEILRTVRGELQQILGISSDPLFTRVFKWRSAMAQYGVGHLERLERIAGLSQQLPHFALSGNAFRGIGVPDCVRSGAQAADAVLTSLGIEAASPQAAIS